MTGCQLPSYKPFDAAHEAAMRRDERSQDGKDGDRRTVVTRQPSRGKVTVLRATMVARRCLQGQLLLNYLSM
jgi:hypothetical protein